MKITIKENAKQEESKYPCLKRSDKGTIILFTSIKAGTVIQSNNYESGYHHNNWEESLFTPFTGTLELSND